MCRLPHTDGVEGGQAINSHVVTVPGSWTQLSADSGVKVETVENSFSGVGGDVVSKSNPRACSRVGSF